MAKFNSFSMVMTLCIATVLVSQTFAFSDLEKKCVGDMTPNCGKEIFGYVLDEKVNGVSATCCAQLVKMGEQCHNGLVKQIFATPEYKAKASLGIPRGQNLFKQCSSAPAPSS